MMKTVVILSHQINQTKPSESKSYKKLLLWEQMFFKRI